MRGTRCNSFVSKQRKEFDSDKDSVASVSSEDSECFGDEVDQEEPTQVDNFGEEFNAIFQSEEELKSNKDGSSCFSPLSQSNIPTHLKSIIEDCGLVFGASSFPLLLR